jgi:hypothetical protein
MKARSSARSMKPIAMPFCQIGIWRSSSGVREALQDGERFAHPARGGVDLVEEQEARNVGFLELAQHEFERRRLAVIRLADHDRGVDRRQDMAHLVQEFDRAGAIDELEALAEEFGGGDVELGAHLMGACLGRRIADAVAGLDRACPREPAAALQMLSSSVVLPLWKGPTIAMHRGPSPLTPVAVPAMRDGVEAMTSSFGVDREEERLKASKSLAA